VTGAARLGLREPVRSSVFIVASIELPAPALIGTTRRA
jgi:hypothetical protein